MIRPGDHKPPEVPKVGQAKRENSGKVLEEPD